MIKINKKSTPSILLKKQEEWTKKLMKAVESHGGYSNIPKTERDSLLAHYRHKDIQKTLAESSHDKCAFCECKPGESSNMEVEHFKPKSLYPELAFDWDNLLPACRRCNEAKLQHDTGSDPIINPCVEDPETLLTYDFIQICPIPGTDKEKIAQTTIDVCGLNCSRLYQARSNLMLELTNYKDELKEKIENINEADTPRKKTIRINKLRNSLDQIDKLLQDDGLYSGFCRWFIAQIPEYQAAKKIVSSIEE